MTRLGARVAGPRCRVRTAWRDRSRLSAGWSWHADTLPAYALIRPGDMGGSGMATANEERVTRTFLELVRIDSPTFQEQAVCRRLAADLEALGLPVEND